MITVLAFVKLMPGYVKINTDWKKTDLPRPPAVVDIRYTL